MSKLIFLVKKLVDSNSKNEKYNSNIKCSINTFYTAMLFMLLKFTVMAYFQHHFLNKL